MKNNNLPFDPSQHVARYYSIRSFVLIGKPVSQIRRYFDGHWEYISPKKFAKEMARLNSESKVIAVEIDETQKAKEAAELLLQ